MKTTLTRLGLTCAALTLIAGCTSAPAPTPTPEPTLAPTVAPTDAPAAEILLVTGEFPPFTGESLEGGGISTEIVTAVFAEMGVAARVEFYPWERAENMVQNGEAWAAFPYVPTEERQARFFISEPLSYARTMWFYHGDPPADVSGDDLAALAPYRIGVSLGYWYISMLEGANLTLDEGSDDIANLRKLQAGRVDLFPVHEYIARWLIQNEFPDDAAAFQMLDVPLDVSPDGLIVSRDYPNTESLLAQFNTALATIQANGTYQAIFDSYGIAAFVPESEGA